MEIGTKFYLQQKETHWCLGLIVKQNRYGVDAKS